MRFIQAALVGISALASLVAAQAPSTTLFFTEAPDSVEVGKTYSLKFKAPTSGPVTITLQGGDDKSHMEDITVLTSSATGGSYSWTVEAPPKKGAYGLKITQGSEINWFGPITFSTTSSETSSASASATGTASASASASASGTTTASSKPTTLTTSYHNSTVTANSTITHGNSTVKTATLTSHKTTSTPVKVSAAATSAQTTAAASTSVGAAPTTNSAAYLSSSVALIFGAIAAMVILN